MVRALCPLINNCGGTYIRETAERNWGATDSMRSAECATAGIPIARHPTTTTEKKTPVGPRVRAGGGISYMRTADEGFATLNTQARDPHGDPYDGRTRKLSLVAVKLKLLYATQECSLEV